jgi:hypothetical protein
MKSPSARAGVASSGGGAVSFFSVDGVIMRLEAGWIIRRVV